MASLSETKFAGRTAVVTGATTGIGLAIAQRFAATAITGGRVHRQQSGFSA